MSLNKKESELNINKKIGIIGSEKSLLRNNFLAIYWNLDLKKINLELNLNIDFKNLNINENQKLSEYLLQNSGLEKDENLSFKDLINQDLNIKKIILQNFKNLKIQEKLETRKEINWMPYSEMVAVWKKLFSDEEIKGKVLGISSKVEKSLRGEFKRSDYGEKFPRRFNKENLETALNRQSADTKTAGVIEALVNSKDAMNDLDNSGQFGMGVKQLLIWLKGGYANDAELTVTTKQENGKKLSIQAREGGDGELYFGFNPEKGKDIEIGKSGTIIELKNIKVQDFEMANIKDAIEKKAKWIDSIEIEFNGKLLKKKSEKTEGKIKIEVTANSIRIEDTGAGMNERLLQKMFLTQTGDKGMIILSKEEASKCLENKGEIKFLESEDEPEITFLRNEEPIDTFKIGKDKLNLGNISFGFELGEIYRVSEARSDVEIDDKFIDNFPLLVKKYLEDKSLEPEKKVMILNVVIIAFDNIQGLNNEKNKSNITSHLKENIKKIKKHIVEIAQPFLKELKENYDLLPNNKIYGRIKPKNKSSKEIMHIDALFLGEKNDVFKAVKEISTKEVTELDGLRSTRGWQLLTVNIKQKNIPEKLEGSYIPGIWKNLKTEYLPVIWDEKNKIVILDDALYKELESSETESEKKYLRVLIESLINDKIKTGYERHNPQSLFLDDPKELKKERESKDMEMKALQESLFEDEEEEDENSETESQKKVNERLEKIILRRLEDKKINISGEGWEKISKKIKIFGIMVVETLGDENLKENDYLLTRYLESITETIYQEIIQKIELGEIQGDLEISVCRNTIKNFNDIHKLLKLNELYDEIFRLTGLSKDELLNISEEEFHQTHLKNIQKEEDAKRAYTQVNRVGTRKLLQRYKNIKKENLFYENPEINNLLKSIEGYNVGKVFVDMDQDELAFMNSYEGSDLDEFIAGIVKKKGLIFNRVKKETYQEIEKVFDVFQKIKKNQKLNVKNKEESQEISSSIRDMKSINKYVNILWEITTIELKLGGILELGFKDELLHKIEKLEDLNLDIEIPERAFKYFDEIKEYKEKIKKMGLLDIKFLYENKDILSKIYELNQYLFNSEEISLPRDIINLLENFKGDNLVRFLKENNIKLDLLEEYQVVLLRKLLKKVRELRQKEKEYFQEKSSKNSEEQEGAESENKIFSNLATVDHVYFILEKFNLEISDEEAKALNKEIEEVVGEGNLQKVLEKIPVMRSIQEKINIFIKTMPKNTDMEMFLQSRVHAFLLNFEGDNYDNFVHKIILEFRSEVYFNAEQKELLISIFKNLKILNEAKKEPNKTKKTQQKNKTFIVPEYPKDLEILKKLKNPLFFKDIEEEIKDFEATIDKIPKDQDRYQIDTLLEKSKIQIIQNLSFLIETKIERKLAINMILWGGEEGSKGFQKLNQDQVEFFMELIGDEKYTENLTEKQELFRLLNNVFQIPNIDLEICKNQFERMKESDLISEVITQLKKAKKSDFEKSPENLKFTNKVRPFLIFSTSNVEMLQVKEDSEEDPHDFGEAVFPAGTELEKIFKIFRTDSITDIKEINKELKELESVDRGKFKTAKQEIRSAIEAQSVEPSADKRENIQNGLDSIDKSGKENGEILIENYLQKEGAEYVESITDNGTGIEDMLKFLIPGESIKKESGDRGFFGKGFYKNFQDVDRIEGSTVIINQKTGKKEKYIFQLIPQKKNGVIQAINLGYLRKSEVSQSVETYATINKIYNTEERIPELQSMITQQTYLTMGGLSQHFGKENTKWYTKDKDENKIELKLEIEKIRTQSFEFKDKANNGNQQMTLAKCEELDSSVSLGGLRMGNFVTKDDSYTKLLDPKMSVLLKENYHLVFENMKPILDRSKLENEKDFIEQIQAFLLVEDLKLITEKLLSDNSFRIEGYSEDIYTNKNYAWIFSEAGEIREIAQKINNQKSLNHRDLKIIAQDHLRGVPNKTLLLYYLEIETKDEITGEITFDSVLSRYAKKQEEMKNFKASMLTSRLLENKHRHKHHSQFNSEESFLVDQGVMLKNLRDPENSESLEDLIIQGKLEKFEVDVLTEYFSYFGVVNVYFSDLDNPGMCRKGEIHINKNYLENKSKISVKFIGTVLHETGHLLEFMAESKFDNLKEGEGIFSDTGSNLKMTHQQDGTFADGYRLVTLYMLKAIASVKNKYL